MLTKTIQEFLQGKESSYFLLQSVSRVFFSFIDNVFSQRIIFKVAVSYWSKNWYLFQVSIDGGFKIFLVLEITYHLYSGASVS